MGQRQQLQALFETILGTDLVYFQPPENTKIQYPCIVYARDNADTIFADNSPYRNLTRYLVTIIDRDPDSAIPAKVAALPLTTFGRFYIADNLNHDVYQMYY